MDVTLVSLLIYFPSSAHPEYMFVGQFLKTQSKNEHSYTPTANPKLILTVFSEITNNIYHLPLCLPNFQPATVSLDWSTQITKWEGKVHKHTQKWVSIGRQCRGVLPWDGKILKHTQGRRAEHGQQILDVNQRKLCSRFRSKKWDHSGF